MSAKTLYETDYAEWAKRITELLRAGRFDGLDLEDLADEIDGLWKCERSSVPYESKYHAAEPSQADNPAGPGLPRLENLDRKETPGGGGQT